MNKTLILEGPNGCGKNAFADKILEYCPYIRFHYADSAIVRDFVGMENLLPVISYSTYETIYTSIMKDPTIYPHIQYRSTITNMVYNSLYREGKDWIKEDEKYFEKFFMEKYDENVTLWIMTYYQEYLDKMDEKTKEGRLRSRTVEMEYLSRINMKYIEIAKRLKEMNPKCNIVLDTGEGMLNPIHQLDADLDKACKSAKSPFPTFVDSDRTPGEVLRKMFDPRMIKDSIIFFVDYKSDLIGKVYNQINQEGLGRSRFTIVENPFPKILFHDFFVIYSVFYMLQHLEYTQPAFVMPLDTKFWINQKRRTDIGQ